MRALSPSHLRSVTRAREKGRYRRGDFAMVLRQRTHTEWRRPACLERIHAQARLERRSFRDASMAEKGSRHVRQIGHSDVVPIYRCRRRPPAKLTTTEQNRSAELITDHRSFFFTPLAYQFARPDQNQARSSRLCYALREPDALYCSECRYPDGVLRPPPPRPQHLRNRSHRQNHQTRKCARYVSSPAPIPGSFSRGLSGPQLLLGQP